MKTSLLLSLLGLCVIGCKTAPEPAKPRVGREPDLVFVGTVKSIQMSALPRSLANWVITFNVETVTRGEFGGDTFSIRVHSPAMSGLKVGRTYIVEAERTEKGYRVDTHQRFRRAHNSIQKRAR